jgi:hypothetical protein
MYSGRLAPGCTEEDADRETLVAFTEIMADTATMKRPVFLKTKPPDPCAYVRLGQLYLLTKRWITTNGSTGFEVDEPGHVKNDAMDWAVRWLTASRTEKNMKDTLCLQCRCSTSPEVYDCHYFGRLMPSTDENCGWELFYMCTSILVRHLSGELKMNHSLLESRQHSQKRQCLPYDPWTSLSSLVGWMNAIEHWSNRDRILNCICMCIQLSHTEILPQLALQPCELIAGVIHTIHDAFEDWYKDPICNGQDQNACEQAVEALSLAGILLYSLLDYSLDPVSNMFFKANEHDLIMRCSEAYRLIKDLAALQERGSLRFSPQTKYAEPGLFHKNSLSYTLVAATIADRSPQLLRVIPNELDLREDIRSYCIGHYPEAIGDFYRLERIITFFAKYQVCRRAGCRRTTGVNGSYLRECAGCHCVYYCSKRCQKKAWVDPYVAHRKVCLEFAAIYGRLSLQHTRKRARHESRPLQDIPRAAITENAALLHYVVENFHYLAEYDVKIT